MPSSGAVVRLCRAALRSANKFEVVEDQRNLSPVQLKLVFRTERVRSAMLAWKISLSTVTFHSRSMVVGKLGCHSGDGGVRIDRVERGACGGDDRWHRPQAVVGETVRRLRC